MPNHIFFSEVIGTGLLILLGDGVVAGVLLSKSKAENSGWIVITFGWAMAVAMAVYAVGQFDGAHLNPAVTLGLAVIGSTSWSNVPSYLGGELVGAFIGAVLVWAHYSHHWKETDDPGLKLAVFSTGPAIRNPLFNIISEIIGTFVLVFGVVAITSKGNSLSGGLAPLLIGLLVFAIGLSLGGPTGYAINPARDLMPRIAHFLLPIPGKGSSDWSYAWIPVVGPIIGGILGAVVAHQLPI
ncbi:MAG: MIP/aquaporin family protein [Candidatus Dormibacteria bacterium]|jgi:glycerol uptake facilitator protein